MLKNNIDLIKNKLKKIKKEDMEKIISEYSKTTNNSFDIEKFNTNSMLKYSNNLLENEMIEKKHYYLRNKDHNYMDNILPAYTLIVLRSKYMSLEKVGTIYRRMDDKYKKTPYAYENPYELQQNFIKAIYTLMIQKKIIDENQKLTTKLQEEICLKYLKRPLIEKIDRKGKTL